MPTGETPLFEARQLKLAKPDEPIFYASTRLCVRVFFPNIILRNILNYSIW